MMPQEAHASGSVLTRVLSETLMGSRTTPDRLRSVLPLASLGIGAAPAPSPSIAGAAGPHDCFVGDLAALCRLAAQYAVALAAPVVAQASTATRAAS